MGGVATRPPLFSLPAKFAALLMMSAPTLVLCCAPRLVMAAETIHIAVALPLSGAQERLGQAIKSAVTAALTDRAAALRDDAPSVDVIWLDDACSGAGGAAVARQVAGMTSTVVVGVIGHACPSAAQTAAPIYSAAGIAFLQAGALPAHREPSLRQGHTHFRLPGQSSQGRTIADALINAGPLARVALVRDRTRFATDALQSVAAALLSAGRSSVLTETFTGGDKDFGPLAQRLKNAAISHVALAAFASEAVLLVPQLRAVNPTLEIIATDQLAGQDFANPLTSEGVRVVMAPDYTSSPRTADLVRRLGASTAAWNRSAIATYAAVEVFAAAADGRTAPAITNELQTNTFQTVLGPVRFDATGAADLPAYVLHTWTNGTLVQSAR